LPNVFCNVANITHWASKIQEGLEVEALASILQDPQKQWSKLFKAF
jgi:hypothetical protein